MIPSLFTKDTLTSLSKVGVSPQGEIGTFIFTTRLMSRPGT